VNKQVGIHIILHKTITQVAQKALELEIPIFQTFAITNAKQPFVLTEQDKKSFLQIRHNFDAIFLHASYWINCANNKSKAERLLSREIIIAQNLEIPFIVLHPGAIAPDQSRKEGIDLIAQRINTILSKFPNIVILLENIAHDKRSIGGNIKDLSLIMNNIDKPERVGFCIDTAHAYVYGYNIADEDEQKNFIDELKAINILDRIKLIHLNDTMEHCGSKIDIHAAPGDGLIGKKALQAFISHPAFQTTPLILEIPKLEDSQEAHIVKTITKW